MDQPVKLDVEFKKPLIILRMSSDEMFLQIEDRLQFSQLFGRYACGSKASQITFQKGQ